MASKQQELDIIESWEQIDETEVIKKFTNFEDYKLRDLSIFPYIWFSNHSFVVHTHRPCVPVPFKERLEPTHCSLLQDLERKLNKLIPSKGSVDSKSSNKLNGTNIDIILTGDDALRSQYVPPEPTVKILKRPTNNQTNNDTKVFQPKKSLKEREQEYAKARLRILGEASSQEKEDEKICIQNKTKVENDNIVRLPRGPDGTKGFTIRR